jgi:DNA-binding XRE family transcriptional regulator
VTNIVRRASVLQPERAARAIRARGFTLEAFAQVAGVSRKTLGDWLSGRRCCQLATELRIVRALRDYPVLIPADPDAANWQVPMPPAARQVVGRPAPPVRAVERPPQRRPEPSLDDYAAALTTVLSLEAWQDHGYRLVASGRAGAAFKRHLIHGRLWAAFPDVYSDEASYRVTEPMTFFRWWWP